MRPFSILLALGISGILSVGTAASAEATRHFTVANKNEQYSIQRVWKAAAGTSDDYEEVYLDFPIAANSSSNFVFNNSGDVCLYDIRVQFSDGVAQEFANVNVCRGDTVSAN